MNSDLRRGTTVAVSDFMLKRSLVFALFVVGCQDAVTTSTNELGLKLTTLDDHHVSGTMTHPERLGVIRRRRDGAEHRQVTFDRGAGEFGSTLDWNTQSADFAYPADMLVTDDDRFVLTALATAVESEVGKDTIVTDNLFRQASLWGAHPTGEIVLTVDHRRSGSRLDDAVLRRRVQQRRSLPHASTTRAATPSAARRVAITRARRRATRAASVATDPTNPCLSRCGAGCNGVGTSAWTQDCGNHDICEYWHTSDCGGELSSRERRLQLRAELRLLVRCLVIPSI